MAKKTNIGSKKPADQTHSYSTPPRGASGNSELREIAAESIVRIAATSISAPPAGTSGHSSLRRLTSLQAIKIG
jgi:hypothetical protein